MDSFVHYQSFALNDLHNYSCIMLFGKQENRLAGLNDILFRIEMLSACQICFGWEFVSGPLVQ